MLCEILSVDAYGARFYVAADTLRRSTICPHLFGSELAVRIWENELDVTAEQIDAAIKAQFGDDVPHPDDVAELDGEGGIAAKPEMRFDNIPMLVDRWQLNSCECCDADDGGHCGCGRVTITHRIEASTDAVGPVITEESRTVCKVHGTTWEA